MKYIIFTIHVLGLVNVCLALNYSPFHEIHTSNNFIHRLFINELVKNCYDPKPSFINNHQTLNFHTNQVKHGDIVYVRHIPKFFKEVHPRIKVPYIIITHGHFSDAFKHQYKAYLNDKNILAWFAVHSRVPKLPKLYHIPLGIIPLPTIIPQKAMYTQYFKKLRTRVPKNKVLYANITPRTQVRKKLITMFKNELYCTFVPKKVHLHQYLEQMAQHKFTLCPSGKGPDSYRTWEALLVGSIPIVESSALNDLYTDLPVVIIKNWKQVTLPFLQKKYRELMAQKKKHNLKKLFIEYWVDKIKKVRNAHLKLIQKKSIVPNILKNYKLPEPTFHIY